MPEIIKKMKKLIIDATGNKILLIIINDKNIYTSSHENSKSNFDKITILINDFLKKYKTTLSDINQIYVNRGPGSFAGIRNSLSIVKAIHLAKDIDYYCFSILDFSENDKEKLKNWQELPNLCRKYKIKKNLINPIY